MTTHKPTRTLLAALAGLLLIVAAACGSDSGSAAESNVPSDAPTSTTAAEPSGTEVPSQTIVELAAASPGLSTLVSAVQAAGLAETLSGEGPFTVFAPTDEAFAALPAGTLDNLLKPENRAQLVEILTYHVVPGEVTSSQIEPGTVATVEGRDLNIAVSSGGVTANDATVTQADVMASNGVVHVIDTVLLPPSS